MKISILTATVVLGLSLPLGAQAQDSPLPAGFSTQPLLKTGVSRDNEPIIYPTGAPEMVSVIGTLAPNGRTALHMHPVPVYVYVLQGTIEVRSEGKPMQRYMSGEAFIETQNHKHQAFNIGKGSAQLLVVFVGEVGKPTTVSAE